MLGQYPILYLALLEYSVHRWVMHRPKSSFWQWHAVEHHRDGKNDDEYLGPLWRSVAIFWVIGSLPMVLLSLDAPLVLGVLMIWWRIVGRQVHLLAHGLSERWVTTTIMCPWAYWVVQHHRQHHRTPAANFGAVFPLTDVFFGTFRRSGETS